MFYVFKEGVVVVDVYGEVNFINFVVEEIFFFGLDKIFVYSFLFDDLQIVLQSGELMYDCELGCNGLLLIGNIVFICSQGVVVGVICIFCDKIEVS